MSLLEGDLAGIIFDAFSSGDMEFIDAVRIRQNITRDAGGDSTSNPTETPILAMVDQMSETTRLALGYTQRDQRIIVLGNSITGDQMTADDLTSDDQIQLLAGTFAGITWGVSSVLIDPAGATATLKGTMV